MMAEAPYQPPAAPKDQAYGQAGQQLAAQGVVPLPTSPVASPGRPRVSGAGDSGGESLLMPGQIPGLTDPSASPDEPITAGLRSGPGPGLEALNTASFAPQELSVLRGIFLRYPNDDLRRMIEFTENNLA